MLFTIERVNKKDGRTISQESIISFFNCVVDYLDRVIACGLRDGFEKEEPIDDVEVEMRFKFNGKEIDDEELIKQYPNLIGLDFKELVKQIIEKNYTHY